MVFFVLPMIDAASFSFFDWSGYGPMTDFVGLKNYQAVLEHRNFFNSVRNSLLVVAVSLAIQLPLALWCALALVEKGWGINVLRLLFFVPYMLAEVAAGLIWRFVYDGDYGLVSAVGHRPRPASAFRAGRQVLGAAGDHGGDRVEVFRLPHDDLHRRAAVDPATR